MLEQYIVLFASLAGVAALIAAVVNVAKVFGLPDGYAPKLSGALSLAAFVALVALGLFAPQVDVAGLDQKAADIAKLIVYLLGFFVQMGLPAKFHQWFSNARIPFIGKSFSREEWDASE